MLLFLVFSGKLYYNEQYDTDTIVISLKIRNIPRQSEKSIRFVRHSIRKGGARVVETDLKSLFRDLRSGSQEAFAILYESLKQPVFTICWRVVQQKELAEDLTHDVFLKLYTSPPDASVKNERAYVFQMARNLSIDALRKSHDTPMDEDMVIPVDGGLDRTNQRLDLEAAMSRLSPEERDILTLHLNADLTFIQIGSILGLSLPAVYRRYRKAIGQLRELLNGGAR